MDDLPDKAPEKKAPRKKVPKKITPDYLHNSGLYYLQRFAASSAHFREVMMRKVRRSCHHHKEQDMAACTAMVDALTQKFQDTGLIDDALYTQGVVNSLRRAGKSQKAIMAKLQQKGLKSGAIKETLEAHDQRRGESEHSAEMEAALIFARRKKIGPFAKEKTDAPDAVKKSMAVMARAGFSYDIVRKVLAADLEEF